MKKQLTIALGFVLTFGAIAGIASASRDAYHNYLYQEGYYNRGYQPSNPEKLAVRPISDRVGGWKVKANRFVNTSPEEKNSSQVSLRLQKNYRGSREQADWAEPRELVVRTGAKNRHFARREGKWQVIAAARSAVAFNNIPDIQYGKTFEANGYIVNFPDTFTVAAEDESIMAEAGDIKVTVEKIDNPCGVLGFYACGVTIAQNRNGHGDTQMRSTSRVERSTIDTYKFVGDNNLTPTYTESFSSTYKGKEQFIVRYLVADSKGESIYIIEGKSSLKDGPKLVASAKKIFNSFHIKADETVSILGDIIVAAE